MGTEILHPQNCFIERMRVPSPAFTNPRRKNITGNRNPNRKKKPEQAGSRRSASFDDHSELPTHVTILRRGQSIGDLKKVSLSPSRIDVYAGSTVSMSPSPRALPLPSFFSKKTVEIVSDDSATREIRRLLRLE